MVLGHWDSYGAGTLGQLWCWDIGTVMVLGHWDSYGVGGIVTAVIKGQATFGVC